METATAISGEASPKLQRWTILTAGLIYLQLVLGGLVRHTASPLGQRGHLVVAFAVVASVVWLIKLAFESPSANQALVRTACLLGVLIAAQILLGVEAWMMKFSAGIAAAGLRPISAREELIRTAHFLLGSGVFATAVGALFQAHRHAVWSFRLSAAGAGRMEGAV
jgi:heme A synthase